jgi:hypothetical protein
MTEIMRCYIGTNCIKDVLDRQVFWHRYRVTHSHLYQWFSVCAFCAFVVIRSTSLPTYSSSGNATTANSRLFRSSLETQHLLSINDLVLRRVLYPPLLSWRLRATARVNTLQQEPINTWIKVVFFFIRSDILCTSLSKLSTHDVQHLGTTN